MGSFINGANKPQAEGIATNQLLGTRSNAKEFCQSEKLAGDQEVILNYNGLSEWQHFNGVAMNQGCGPIGAADNSSSKLDYQFRDSQVVSHQDCILDMGMLELPNHDPVLITCGRDGLVKLWR